MGRFLKTRGWPGAARMLIAGFDGFVRDGATFELRGSQRSVNDGDLIAFDYPDGLAAGISVAEDDDGLYSLVSLGPHRSLRIGLEALGPGIYAFRPARRHVEMWPELSAKGAGAKIG